MKKKIKKILCFAVIMKLCLAVVTLFVAVGCDKMEIPPKTDSNVNFTPCQQSEIGSNSKVDVEFTGKGVQITYYKFEVTCDFSTVNVTHTFVNGVLNITQQGTPNQEDCICYTDVSYTINGISQDKVNVIFINGVQVYCYNGNGNNEGDVPYKECTHEDDYMHTIQMKGAGYLFINFIPVELQKENNVMYIIYNQEDHSTTFSARYPTEAIYNGNICNFPDFAKEWEIPTDGKQIYYEGELYVTGMYADWPPHTGGDLILTTLKQR